MIAAAVVLDSEIVALGDEAADLRELYRLARQCNGEVVLVEQLDVRANGSQMAFDFDAPPPTVHRPSAIFSTRPTSDPHQPDLRTFDWILVNSSGGKDSQAMLDYVVELADRAGVPRSTIVVVHADLGRVEWEGVKELAAEQAAHYGLRFEVVARDRDLLHQIEHERKKFPDNARRYCTSDQKTSQVTKLITRLVAEVGARRPVRILNCLGMRAQESPTRAKLAPLTVDKVSNSKREVVRWLPIHAWTVEQVWDRIQQSGVRHHPAYDSGMPRLSCSFCVLASKGALVRAATLRPDLAAEYARIEAKIGHTFRKDLSMAKIIELAQADDATAPVEGWAA